MKLCPHNPHQGGLLLLSKKSLGKGPIEGSSLLIFIKLTKREEFNWGCQISEIKKKKL